MAEDNVADLPNVEERPSRLRTALRKARLTEAERSDVIVDLREAEIARLELLQDALSDVFEEIPPDNDLLECALIPGTPPRLWIDVLGYVVMGRDKRTYRFVKESRYRRQVILETAHLEEMAGRVTDYVAHRLIERQRALETEDANYPAAAQKPEADEQPAPDVAAPAGRFGWGTVTSSFILGMLAGAAALFSLGLILIAR